MGTGYPRPAALAHELGFSSEPGPGIAEARERAADADGLGVNVEPPLVDGNPVPGPCRSRAPAPAPDRVLLLHGVAGARNGAGGWFAGMGVEWGIRWKGTKQLWTVC